MNEKDMIDARTRAAATVPASSDIESLSRLMDAWFQVPGVGWRFGLNTILDLVPGFGDVVTSMISFSILLSAARRGIARVTLLRMALNVGIYAVIGAIPWLGDAVDTWFKPNMRNMALLRREMESPADVSSHHRADSLFVGTVLTVLALLLVGSVTVVFWILGHILPHIFQASARSL